MSYSSIAEFELRGKSFRIATHGWSDEFISRILINGSFDELNLLSHIAERYPVQKVILDIGANIGNHTIYFAEFLQADRIHSFEPYPASFLLLERNTEQYPHVSLYNTALGAQEGLVSMYAPPNNMANAHITGTNSTSNISMVPLDSFGFEDVTLMKVDVEGYELEVFKGGMETIRRCRPVLFVECFTDERIWFVEHLLSPLGYTLIGDFSRLFELIPSGEVSTDKGDEHE